METDSDVENKLVVTIGEKERERDKLGAYKLLQIQTTMYKVDKQQGYMV